MVLGYFGKTPTKPDAKIVKIASEQLGLEPTKESPLKINDADPTKGIAPAKALLEKEGLPTTDENIFIAATCKDKGIAYLKGEATLSIRKNQAAKPVEQNSKDMDYRVTVDNRDFNVVLKDNKAIVNGKTYDFSIAYNDSKAVSAGASVSSDIEVSAPIPGTVVRVNFAAGDLVEANETIFIVEAMKMETEIKAPAGGTIDKIFVAQGDQVAADQVVAYIS
jgi:pyruvate carboxylase subunit B